MRYDVAIIGGGIVGAATLYKMQLAHPELKMILIEKEDMLADHQTGHNSGVIHSGLYYKPGSLKALNCKKGRLELVEFAKGTRNRP
jgi:L-2-hydroxyglutarate oxidase